jgi:hypothetical protein
LYIWNGIKICIDGKDNKFISDIRKYFYATYTENKIEDCDIVFSVYDRNEQKLPEISKDARLVSSYVLVLENETLIRIYLHEEQIWYFYQDLAEIWVDFKNNKIILSLNEKLFPFAYYNILFFFLYPLSSLLENFGYFRAHSSSVDIKDKAFLFTGDSGSGKSTSAFAIAANGGSIISDDMTFIKKTADSYKAYTITRLVKLRNDIILKFFPELLQYERLKNNEEEMYFNVDNINSEIPGPAIIKALIILEKTGKRNSDVIKVHPSKIVPHLFPSAIRTSIERFTHREFNFFTDILNEVECYKVYFGTDMADFYKVIAGISSKEVL